MVKWQQPIWKAKQTELIQSFCRYKNNKIELKKKKNATLYITPLLKFNFEALRTKFGNPQILQKKYLHILIN